MAPEVSLVDAGLKVTYQLEMPGNRHMLDNRASSRVERQQTKRFSPAVRNKREACARVR